MTASNTRDVTSRVRAAIKAKLEELGVYVDDELPDYIMIMIANKKEKKSMMNDLLLFLGTNTIAFVNWLYATLERLQSAANAAQEAAAKAGRTNNSTSGSRKEKSDASESSQKKNLEVPENSEEQEQLPAPREEHKLVRETENAKKNEHKRSAVPLKPSDKNEDVKRDVRKRIEHPKEDRSLRKRTSDQSNLDRSVPTRLDPTRRNFVEEIKEQIGDGRNSIDKKQIGDGRISIDKKQIGDGRISIDKKQNDSDHKPLVHCSEAIGSKNYASISKAKVSVVTEKSSRLGNSKLKQRSMDGRARKNDSSSDLCDDENAFEDDDDNDGLPNKKVQSSAFAKLVSRPAPKTVSSQIIVKRKINSDSIMKHACGGSRLFLKALKDVGGEVQLKPPRSCVTNSGSGPGIKSVPEIDDEAIEIDAYDDLSDLCAASFRPKESKATKLIPGRISIPGSCVDELHHPKRRCVELATDPNKNGSRFMVTVDGSNRRVSKREQRPNIISAAGRKTLKRCNNNPILAHLNSRSYPARDGSDIKECESEEHAEGSNKVIMEYSASPYDECYKNDDAVMVESRAEVDKSTCSPGNAMAWNGRIQLQEGDSSDDEAAIDALLASVDANQLEPEKFVRGTDGERQLERCKFWPKCRLGDSCLYTHPTIQCSNFPNCRFGDHCIYVHPMCKFEPNCTNPHCSFTHQSRDVLSGVADHSENAIVLPHSNKANSISCRYGGSCTNPACVYKHPKACRFGPRCTNMDCYFRHLPQKCYQTCSSLEKYKWKATKPREETGNIC